MAARRMPEGNYGRNRRDSVRRRRAVFTVFCEGQKTEPEYLKELGARLRVIIRPVKIGGPFDEKALKRATDAKNSEQQKRDIKEQGDQVWCVFDVENPQQQSHAEGLARRAEETGLHVALSNPCIEFWFLLHFEMTTREYANCNEVETALRAHLGVYSKNSCPFEKLEHRTDDAIINSVQVLNYLSQTGALRPYTHIHELVCALRATHEEQTR